MRLRLSLLAAFMVALAAVFAGCGGSSNNGITSKSPTEILTATEAAADAASSVHVSGATASTTTPVTLDLSLVSGKGGKGQISTNGLSVEVVELEGTVYLKGSAAFYSRFAGTSAAQLLQGKWLKAPVGNSEFAALGSLTNLRKLLDEGLAHHGTLAKGTPTTINGQAAIGITDTTKGGTLYVATTGQPYPIEIVKSGAESGKITFSEWNVPVALTAPANAIDISQLKAGH